MYLDSSKVVTPLRGGCDILELFPAFTSYRSVPGCCQSHSYPIVKPQCSGNTVPTPILRHPSNHAVPIPCQAGNTPPDACPDRSFKQAGPNPTYGQTKQS